MSEDKEISRTSKEIEQIKLNSDGCNLNLVSVLVRFLVIFFAMILSCISLPRRTLIELLPEFITIFCYLQMWS
jgi:hypothetical protein